MTQTLTTAPVAPTKVRTALISVFHKTGITEFVQNLVAMGFKILASGGTARHLKAAGIEVTDVAEIIGGAAILGHKVVTLSRQVHAGLLADYAGNDLIEMQKLGLPYIDLVCVDLYPLETEIAKPEATLASVIAQTDIGGPTMIRSGTKGRRIVVCDPSDRQTVIDWLKNGEPDREAFIGALCAKAEYTIAKYCMASARYLSGGDYVGFFGLKVLACKYGENAWQTPAAVFSSGTNDPLALDKFAVVEGTPPSYNNMCDVDRLLQTITHTAAVFEKNFNQVPLIAIGVKHGNACGAAVGDNPIEVLEKMMAGDKEAIFGGLIMTNFPIGPDEAAVLQGKMLDGIIAPSFPDKDVFEQLRRKGDKCRFIVNPALQALGMKSLDSAPRFRYVRGGMLVQPNYTYVPDLRKDAVANMEVSIGQLRDLALAWAIGSTSNSNTITLVKNGQLIGNGVGQQSRVGGAKVAIMRADHAQHVVKGSVAYSDSFFPFDDGPKRLIEAGVAAILTSSGSIRDKDTIALCNNWKLPLLMIADKDGRGFYGH